MCVAQTNKCCLGAESEVRKKVQATSAREIIQMQQCPHIIMFAAGLQIDLNGSQQAHNVIRL